jgi:hypothetical protein
MLPHFLERIFVSKYLDVMKQNPNLVKQHGALAVFQVFVVLAAYDPAHGGNYATRTPVKERKNSPSPTTQLEKGIDEAEAELGVAEQ